MDLSHPKKRRSKIIGQRIRSGHHNRILVALNSDTEQRLCNNSTKICLESFVEKLRTISKFLVQPSPRSNAHYCRRRRDTPAKGAKSKLELGLNSSLLVFNLIFDIIMKVIIAATQL